MQVPTAGRLIASCGHSVFSFSSAVVIALTLMMTSPESRAAQAAQSVTLFAAASTTNALKEIVALYNERSGTRIRTVFAASSTLARQIAAGAPADLFLSANERWMEHLVEKSAVEAGTRHALVGNRLVLVVSPQAARPAPGPARTLDSSLPLGEIIGNSRLAIGDPAHVPAGIYAKAALQSLGLWEDHSGKLAFSGNVRTALALVDRGEAAAGIVYETDALLLPDLDVAGIFPADSHPPIVYPLAIVAGRQSDAVEEFYGFLRGPEAAKVFLRHGFSASEASN